jgi:hypothetical protein
MLTATRLTYRISRFEFVAIVVAAIASVVVSAVVVTWIRQSGYLACMTSAGGAPTVACLGLFEDGQWFERIARASLGLVPVFPFVAGAVLGAPVVARELDRGTARLAWSLSPSRTRWLIHRLVPALVVVLAASAAVGVVAEWLTAIQAPGVDLSRSFIGFHERGLLIATSALVIASIGVLVGAVIGRPLPALIAAIVLGGLTLLAVSELHKNVMRGETISQSDDIYNESDLYLDGRFQLPDGTLATWEELVALDPSIQETGPTYPFVSLVIPGTRYQAIEIREAAAHVGLIVVFLAGAGVVVQRRRPG